MSPDQILTLKHLQERVSRIPEDVSLPSGEVLSCHTLARALLRFPYPVELRVIDGWFSVFNHSWLIHKFPVNVSETRFFFSVFDVYPVGTFTSKETQVIFVAGEVAKWIYQDVDARKQEFRRKKEEDPESIFDPQFVESPVEEDDKLLRDVDYVARIIDH